LNKVVSIVFKQYIKCNVLLVCWSGIGLLLFDVQLVRDFSEQDNYSIDFSLENCKENGNNNGQYELSEKCTHVQVEPGTYVIK
jgi:hypothetical protein